MARGSRTAGWGDGWEGGGQEASKREEDFEVGFLILKQNKGYTVFWPKARSVCIVLIVKNVSQKGPWPGGF